MSSLTPPRLCSSKNAGQWANEAVHFVHNGSGANVLHTSDGIIFELFRHSAEQEESAPSFEATTFQVSFLGSQAFNPIGQDVSASTFNYQQGDESQWRSSVAAYETVVYQGLYAGVDLYTWGQRSSLKYEFHVEPGSSHEQIRLSYDGVEGLSIAEDGSLIVSLGGGWGNVIDDAPYSYQIIDGREVEVASRFVLLDDSTVGFEITGEYDPSIELIIDPDLAWSTYLGGQDWDYGSSIAVDGSGNVYVTGRTGSSSWVSGGYDTSFNGNSDTFVVKLSSTGQHLWSTYLGGSANDEGYSIAVDGSGDIYVAGATSSTGWVSGGYDTSFNGDYDAFVVKLSGTGQHLWSTYLGGEDDESAYSIAVDGSGNVYVAGRTTSSDWVSGGYDISLDGYSDAFVVMLSSMGQHLWSTYLGGSGADSGSSIAVDVSGNVYVAGTTTSSDWVSGGYDISLDGYSDAFVVMLSSIGHHLWSTYLGGSDDDHGTSIAVDVSGNVYVAGVTYSSGWVSGGYDTSYDGDADGFVVKISEIGSSTPAPMVEVRGNNVAIGDGDSSPSSDDHTHFGSVTEGRSAITRSFTIYNTGDTVLTLGNLTVPAGFTITQNLPATIAAGSSAIFSVRLDTTTVGTKTGQISFTTNDSDENPYNFTITGVVEFDASFVKHLWSTYLGESGEDSGYSIAVDGSGSVYVTGTTTSPGWVSGGYDTSLDGYSDAFVVKLSSTGQHLWSTYLGGEDSEDGNSIAVDGSGNVYVTGRTSSSGWVSGGYDTSGNRGDDDSSDAFVVKLSSTGQHLWSTYLGGEDSEDGNSIAVDGSGNVYVAGTTSSSGWVSGGYDTSRNGDSDAFVLKISGTGSSTPAPEVEVRGNGVVIDDGDSTPLSSDHTNFGSVTEGESAITRSFTVYNTGDAPLTLSNLTVPVGFTITQNLPATIAAGSSAVFSVRLDAATVGTKTGQISFTTNDSDENPYNFTITGMVEAAQVTPVNSITTSLPVAYVDSDGTKVTVTLKGGGSASLTFTGEGLTFEEGKKGVTVTGSDVLLDTLALADTTSKSTLTIKTDKGGDGKAAIGSIESTSALKSLTAKTTDLIGAGIVFTDDGIIASVQLADLLNGADILMTGGSVPKGVTLQLGRIGSGSDIINASPIKTLKAVEWISGQLTAGSISTLQTTGDRKASIAGDFGADVTLDGANAAVSLKTAKIAGVITGGAWSIAGDVGTIQSAGFDGSWSLDMDGQVKTLNAGKGAIAGEITAANFGTIRSKGGDLTAAITATGNDAKGVSIKSLQAGQVNGATVFAPGSVGTIKVTDWIGGSIEAGSIKTLQTTGDKKASIAGDFNAPLTLTNGDVPHTLNSTKIAGSVNNTNWSIAGQANTITVLGGLTDFSLTLLQGVDPSQPKLLALKTLVVKGQADNVLLRSSGHVGSITLGSVRDSRFLLGTNSVLTALPDDDMVLSSSVNLNKFMIKGIKGQNGPTFASSLVVARSIGQVSLQTGEGDNQGDALGIAAQSVGKYRRLLDPKGSISLKNLTAEGDQDSLGDYKLRIL